LQREPVNGPSLVRSTLGSQGKQIANTL